MNKTPNNKFSSSGSQKTVLILNADSNYQKVRESQKRENKGKNSGKRSGLSPQKRSPNSVQASNRSGLYKKKQSVLGEMQEVVHEVMVSREDIEKALQFIKEVDSHSQEQRCLEHNNVVTLYCVNDRKLMCIYCIYGINRHRTHKILPVNETMDYVVEDVEKLKSRFSEGLKQLEDVIDESKAGTESFQNLLKQTLAQIEREYYRRREQLEATYAREKELVISRYEELISVSQRVSSNYGEIKFAIWEYQAKYNMSRTRLHDVKQNLSQHVVLDYILSTLAKLPTEAFDQDQVHRRIFAKGELTLTGNGHSHDPYGLSSSRVTQNTNTVSPKKPLKK